MSKMVKAKVIKGRYLGETVRVSNLSLDERGQQKAACILSDGTRANILASELELLQKAREPEIIKPKTASMPFISGAASSRTLTQTKNMAKLRPEAKTPAISKKITLRRCEKCDQDFNLEDRKGRPGKLTECDNCATETESKMEGTMIFSHKTGATIEIKKDGELRHEAEIFDPKNKI
jgi:hypothetical protein